MCSGETTGHQCLLRNDMSTRAILREEINELFSQMKRSDIRIRRESERPIDIMYGLFGGFEIGLVVLYVGYLHDGPDRVQVICQLLKFGAVLTCYRKTNRPRIGIFFALCMSS